MGFFFITYSRYRACRARAHRCYVKVIGGVCSGDAPCKKGAGYNLPLVFSRRNVNFVVALCSATVTDSCFIYIFLPPLLGKLSRCRVPRLLWQFPFPRALGLWRRASGADSSLRVWTACLSCPASLADRRPGQPRETLRGFVFFPLFPSSFLKSGQQQTALLGGKSRVSPILGAN